MKTAEFAPATRAPNGNAAVQAHTVPRSVRIFALLETATLSGPAKNVLQFCRSVRELYGRSGPEITIGTFDRSLASGSTEFLDAVRDCGLPLVRIPERFSYDGAIIKELRSVIARVQPHIIETHAVKSHAVVRLSGVHRNIGWVAFHHGHTASSWHSPLYNSLDRWSLRGAAVVVTMNSRFREQLVQQGVPDNRITVLHNGVAASAQPVESAEVRRKDCKLALGIAPDTAVLLCVGRLSREKGHIDLIRAFHHLRSLKPEKRSVLMLVGDGPERQRITKELESAGLRHDVIFVGQVKNVAGYYATADVLVIPSWSEGSPNVLLEAMAAGVPTVATWVGGIPEIAMHRETAMLVPPHSPVSLAEAMNELLTQPHFAVQLAWNARERVQKQFTAEKRAQALSEIYGRALQSQMMGDQP